MKNVVVTVLGLSPAVVTETLWALAHRTRNGKPDPFHADEIHILTTARGMAMIEQRLAGDHGAVARFAADYGLKPPVLHPVAVRDDQGTLLPDIRTGADSVRLADTAVDLVAALTDDDHVRVHASMAGGRKTMSFFMGYVLSLFGRERDELSHVLLLDDRFERCPDFYYPTPAPRTLSYVDRATNRTVTLDAAGARLDLCPIPFVRLGDYLPARDRERLRHGSFADVVALIEELLAPPTLTFNDRTREVQAGRRRFQLPHREYAMYRLLAEVAKDEEAGAGRDGIGPDHRGWLAAAGFSAMGDSAVNRFLAIYDRVCGIESQVNAKFRTALAKSEQVGPETVINTFSQIRSKLDKALEEALPEPALRRRFAVTREKAKPSRFGLTLAPEQIRFLEP